MPFSHILLPLSLSLFLSLFLSLTNAHPCSPHFSADLPPKFTNCRKKTLGAEFAWLFNRTSRRLDIAFGAKLAGDTGWVAWGLNPGGPHMVGTRALVGMKHRNGSLEPQQYNVTGATKSGCRLEPAGDVGLNVSRFGFVYWERSEYYVIEATVVLPYEYDSSRANVVWQIGAAAESGPEMHRRSLDNLNSAEVLDFGSGDIATYTAHLRRQLRGAHGILNIVGWGTLLPMGVIVARYFRRYPKRWVRWFNCHVIFQSTGYIVGSTGWALGIWLGNTSRYYSFHMHHILGTIIFTFTTIQMLALVLRPKGDDDSRIYWNMYHHFLGYAMLSLISVNIFLGIKILEPNHVWKWAYIGVLGALGIVALAFEVFSWIIFLVQKKCSK